MGSRPTGTSPDRPSRSAEGVDEVRAGKGGLGPRIWVGRRRSLRERSTSVVGVQQQVGEKRARFETPPWRGADNRGCRRPVVRSSRTDEQVASAPSSWISARLSASRCRRGPGGIVRGSTHSAHLLDERPARRRSRLETRKGEWQRDLTSCLTSATAERRERKRQVERRAPDLRDVWPD